MEKIIKISIKDSVTWEWIQLNFRCLGLAYNCFLLVGLSLSYQTPTKTTKIIRLLGTKQFATSNRFSVDIEGTYTKRASRCHDVLQN